jgi:GNAT superfamily N-acetyltransferase
MSLRLKIPDSEDYEMLKSIEDLVFYHTPHVQIAYFNDNFVGFCAVELRSDHFFLKKLFVESAYRGRGVGSKLVSCLKKRLRHSRRTIEAETDERDIEMQLFLKKNGFVCYSMEGHDPLVYKFAYFL